MRCRADVLALFKCPSCAAALEAQAVVTAPDGHVIEGALACQSCDARVPITGGIPRFADHTASAPASRTVAGFGFQWNYWRRPLRGTTFESPAVFLDFIAPVAPAYFQDKVVLDAGCGLGRFSRLSSEFGAKLVVGIDLSEAVEAAFANTRHLDNVVIAQANLFDLPLVQAFDYAFSVGVLHHTPDPAGAFRSVLRHVRPGGGISAWVYGLEGNEGVLKVLDPVRRVTSRLPPPVLLALAHLATLPLYLAVKTIYAPVGRYGTLAWLRRRLFYYEYLHFLSQFGFRELAIIVFDHAVPEIAAYLSRDEFEAWFVEEHLVDIAISQRSANSWRGFGMRQALASAPLE